MKTKYLKKLPVCEYCRMKLAEFECDTKLEHLPRARLCQCCFSRIGFQTDTSYRLRLRG